MKNKKYLVIAIICLALIGAAFAFFLWPKPTTIAFYDIDAELVAQVSSVVDDWAKNTKTKIKIQNTMLSELNKNTVDSADVVFLYPSSQNINKSILFSTIADDATKFLSIPFKQSIAHEGRIWALPVLADAWELSWNKALLPISMKEPALHDLVASLSILSSAKPPLLIICGADDKTIIDIAGLLVLEQGGLAAYKTLCEAIYLKKDFNTVLKTDLGDGRLEKALEVLVSWRKLGVLHPNWLDFTAKDIQAFMEFSKLAVDTVLPSGTSEIAKIAVQSLSQRRSIPSELLFNWASRTHVLPTKIGLSLVSARTLSVAKSLNTKKSDNIDSLLLYLSSVDGQAALQKATGLAPVSTVAQAVDMQADAVRTAVISGKVLQSLSLNAFDTNSDRENFAKQLRLYLQSRF